MNSAQLPIGVFDSGLGGLTVLRAIHERLPFETPSILVILAAPPMARSLKTPSSSIRCRLHDFCWKKKSR